MEEDEGADKQTWNSDAVADLLEHMASRAQCWRSDKGSAVVVHNNADNSICDGHSGLADDEGLGIMLRLTHLRDD